MPATSFSHFQLKTKLILFVIILHCASIASEDNSTLANTTSPDSPLPNPELSLSIPELDVILSDSDVTEENLGIVTEDSEASLPGLEITIDDSAPVTFGDSDISVNDEGPIVFVNLGENSPASLNTITFDPSFEHWEDFQSRFCRRSCFRGELMEHGCSSPICFPCSCSPTCHIYGTCCPNHKSSNEVAIVIGEQESSPNSADERHEVLKEYVSDPAIIPSSERFTCSHILQYPPANNDVPTYFMLTDCPGEHANTTLRDLCETPVEGSRDGDSPCIHPRTGIMFTNKFCAECNGFRVKFLPIDAQQSKAELYVRDYHDLDVIQLAPTIACDHYQDLYSITDNFEFYRQTRQVSYCSLEFEIPKNSTPPTECVLKWYQAKPEQGPESCSSDDQTLNDLCASVNGTAYRTLGYKNVFCFLCQGRTAQYRDCSPVVNPGLNVRSALSMLLGFASFEKGKERPDCKLSGYWMDDKGVCKKGLCTPGKVFVEGDNCTTPISLIRGLGYNISIELTPAKDFVLNWSEIEIVSYKVSGLMDPLADVYISFVLDSYPNNDSSHLENSRLSPDSINNNDSTDNNSDNNKNDNNIDNNSHQYRLKSIEVSGQLVGNPVYNRDEFEGMFLQMVKDGITFDLPGEGAVDFAITNHLGKNEPDSQNIIDWAAGYPLPPVPDYLGKPLLSEIHFLSTQYGSSKEIYRLYRYRSRSLIYRIDYDDRRSYLNLTRQLTCPYVVVENLQSDVSSNKRFFIFGKEKIEVDEDDWISFKGDKGTICVDGFNDITRHARPREKVDVPLSSTIQQYLLISCLVLSVTCLLITILTYCLFPSLRTLPGLNNMALCVSLMVAQLSLLTFVFAASSDIPHGTCQFLGVLLHYSWLASFSWMCVCCVHMFRVFSSISTKFLDTRSDGKRFGNYCIIAFVSAGAAVGANVGITSFLSEGTSNGYNYYICYLDMPYSNLLPLLAMLLPLILVIFINTTLFLLTFWKIKRDLMPRGGSSRESANVLTYVKLSSLTGAFWTFAIVGAISDFPVLEMVAIPLVSLQGLFIFFSFTLNKRTKELYCSMFHKKPKKPIKFATTKLTETSSVKKSRSSDNEAVGTKVNVFYGNRIVTHL